MKKIVICLVCAVLIQCAPTTRITGSWKNEKEAGRPVTNVFIAALTSNTIIKSTLENDIENAMKAQGLKTVKSINEFQPSFAKDSVSKDEIMKTVLSKECDAIMTVTVLKKATETRYVGGGYSPMARYSFYGSFWGYYNHWSPYAYDPGYYTQDDVYYLETNLYDSRTEMLLWSAQSESYSYSGIASFSKSFSKVIVDALMANRLIPVGNTAPQNNDKSVKR